jgi:hypothetical protein
MVDLTKLRKLTYELYLMYLEDVDNERDLEMIKKRNPRKTYEGGFTQYPDNIEYPKQDNRPEESDSRVNIRKSNRKRK